jgi:LuxR family maltose regulon positive regulatory protein
MYAILGNEQASQADYLKALELAEPEGFISIFIEEGEPVTHMLNHIHKSSGLSPTLSGYVERILGAFPLQKDTPDVPLASKQYVSLTTYVIESLTRREIEILQLIANGYSNQDIAAHLVLSLHTVKKHISNIFMKLGVNSRTQAIARAHQLNILKD